MVYMLGDTFYLNKDVRQICTMALMIWKFGDIAIDGSIQTKNIVIIQRFSIASFAFKTILYACFLESSYNLLW